MKRLLLTAGLVALLASAHGASMNWGTGITYKPDTSDTENPIAFSGNKCGTTVTAYLFELTASAYKDLLVDAAGASVTSQASADFAKTAAKVFSTYATVDSKTGAITVSDATQSGKTVTLTHYKTFADTATYAVGDTAYAAMILTTSATVNGETKYYYIANIGEWTFEANVDGNLTGFGTSQWGDATKTALDGWTMTSVTPDPGPEPTTGLLLLVGLAGLSLRRKRS